MSIFELTVNLGLVLTKLDTELGLAQPQLVQLMTIVIKVRRQPCVIETNGRLYYNF